MKKPRTFITSMSLMTLLVAGVGLGAGSASAAEIGSGRAIIRIDAPSAQATNEAFGSYTLTIPTGSTGQWMGERPGAAGKSGLRVGNVSAKQLSSKWKDFRYTAAGARATLTWNTGSKKQYRLVRISRPSVTDSGVSFTLASEGYLPTKMSNVTLNLQRAPQKLVRTSYDASHTVTLSGALQFFAGIYEENSKADVRLFNSGNNNTCWSHTFGAVGQTVGIPDGTCDDVQHTGGNSTFKFTPPGCSGCFSNGSTEVTVATTLQPEGEAAFSYSTVVVQYEGW